MNSAPPSDLGRAGQLVGGKFRLDEVIGRGGMGSVWSATHVTLGHRVAIKLVAREFVRSPDALRRFDAEAKAAARLQSRHVVQVFDNGTLDDGTPYIAMELLAGESLADRIARGPISLAETVTILGQACKALARAHAAGVIHRDIKPDNIFLAKTPDEDEPVTKLLDFGVAKMTLDFEGGGGMLTGTGAVLGTPLFMSPEQVKGAKDIDRRTDIYSLGLVAYTMLTGQLAISGDTFGTVLLRICTEPLPSLCAGAPWLPPSMDRWFGRVCAREAADRCPTSQEFFDSLCASASYGRVDSPPAPQPPFLPKTTLQSAGIPRPPSTFGQSGAAVSVSAAGVPRRPRGPFIAGGMLVALFALGIGGIWAIAPKSAPAPTPSTALSGASSASALASSGAFGATDASGAEGARDASAAVLSTPSKGTALAPLSAPAPVARPSPPPPVAPRGGVPPPPPVVPPPRPTAPPRIEVGF